MQAFQELGYELNREGKLDVKDMVDEIQTAQGLFDQGRGEVESRGVEAVRVVRGVTASTLASTEFRVFRVASTDVV